jgi:hypothetical protein
VTKIQGIGFVENCPSRMSGQQVARTGYFETLLFDRPSNPIGDRRHRHNTGEAFDRSNSVALDLPENISQFARMNCIASEAFAFINGMRQKAGWRDRPSRPPLRLMK